MATDLYSVQETIEQQQRDNTIHRFQSDLTNKKQIHQESATYYGNSLMKRAIEPFASMIGEYVSNSSKGKAGNNNTAVKLIRDFKPETIAFIAAKSLIDRFSSRVRLSDVAIHIGQCIEDEHKFTLFKEKFPHLFTKVVNEASDSRKRKRQNINAAANRYDKSWNSWSKTQKLHLGIKLIDLFIASTGYAEIETRRTNKNKVEKIIIPTTAVCEFIEKNEGLASLLQPMYMPMVVEPEPWTKPTGGGYLTHYTRPMPLVKTPNRHYLEELEGMTEEMSEVYEAINHIQKTPWMVNPFVLVAFQIVYERGLNVAGLPSREDIPVPPSPLTKEQNTKELDEETKAKFKAWKKEATAIYEENIRLKSKRLQAAKTKSIAEQFAVYERIYFPHQFDFRGRVYPVPMFLNPQGNSLSKGLLMFADGKPLATEEAAGEFLIHGANCFGIDKVSLQDRIDWVTENHDAILAVASDPIGNLWWAKEADDPWCFLAWCNEYASYVEHGFDHVSYLPVAKDGSCSGLQHFSAALRDPIGGAAVNLMPTDVPADIYQTVIDKVVRMVQADIHTDKAEIANLWLEFGMTRKTAKRSTMTMVYGSTQFSGRAFVQEYITEVTERRKQEDPNYDSPLRGIEFDASVYLAAKVWTAINDTVIAAKDGMEYLQTCARQLARQNLPIIWRTLDGFPIMQNYPNTIQRRVKTHIGDKLVFISLREEKQNRLDSRKQANGISPNWVHGNDGCHLRMTVNLAAANGVSHFAMVHDSFGCHAADIPTLAACLRQAFVNLYVDYDPLADFKAQTEHAANINLPPLPDKGTLDVTSVTDSEFFFA
jgi:DNA-directed RNA polymerase